MKDSLSLHRQSQDIPIKNKAVTPRKMAFSPRPCGVTVICMLRDWRL